ncbi:RrF2 family transcriptional regulator [Amycolatopsis pigmentata]|uniref:RrF2 family transcriptional regulator n=1 Tax=Amycolatopsis pigmentata TaxID=450801 RepID=A0ABW5G2H1_9PSEU
MRLTKFTDLALRVVLRLAQAGESGALTPDAVARSVGATDTEIADVVDRLRRLGVVRGRAELTLSPSGPQASLGMLVRELEGSGDVAGCHDDPPCPLTGACRLRGILRTAQDAFYASLDPITVRDLTSPPRSRLQWLGAPVIAPR